jgi:hypothetical protein
MMVDEWLSPLGRGVTLYFPEHNHLFHICLNASSTSRSKGQQREREQERERERERGSFVVLKETLVINYSW